MMQTRGRATLEEGEIKNENLRNCSTQRPRSAALHPQNCSLHVDAAVPENSQEKEW